MSERGFTLVEVLVAMTLGVVVLATCVSVLTSATRRSDAVERRTDSLLRARAAMDAAQRSLRAQACVTVPDGSPAVPIVSATATAVTFYADLAGTGSPARRTLELRADGSFTETAWPNAAGTGTPTVRRLATGIQSLPSTPVFGYYAYNTSRPPQPDRVLTPATGGLSAADRARVARIDIRFRAQPSGASTATSPRGTDLRDAVLVRLTDPDGATVPQCI